MVRSFLYTLIILLFFQNSYGQRSAYFKRVFVDAEYYFLYEEFRDALPLYLEIFNAYPENANISFRIGVCYLNIPNEKHKAIPYLERAISNVTSSYMEGYFTEVKAPREALYYHGIAFRIKGDFERATQSFNNYRSKLSDRETQEIAKVEKQLESITHAKRLIANPVEVKFTSVGRTINTRFSEMTPVVSANSSLMVYTSRQQFYNAILLSRFEKGEWQHPVNLNNQLLADGPIHTVGISGDGNTIVLARNDNDVYNLYSSSYDPKRRQWTPIARFPKEVNSRFWETYGSLNYRGDTLFFSSNRPGGSGGFDLYYSVKVPLGWSNPVSLGSEINTPFDEIAPFVTYDGKKLYFASRGHETMGDYDIFMSQKLDGKWTTPVNLGYPLNTTDDDVFFFPIGNGNMGVVSRMMSETHGEDDIYWVQFDLNPNDGLSLSPISNGTHNDEETSRTSGSHAVNPNN